MFQDMLTGDLHGIRWQTTVAVDGERWTGKSTWTRSSRSMTQDKNMEVTYGATASRTCMMVIAEGLDTVLSLSAILESSEGP